MSRVKLDFSRLKYMSHDDDSVTLEHRDGHSIKLARKALSKDAQDQLSAMTKGSDLPKEDKMAAELERKAAKEAPENTKPTIQMAEGGEVKERIPLSEVPGAIGRGIQSVASGITDAVFPNTPSEMDAAGNALLPSQVGDQTALAPATSEALGLSEKPLMANQPEAVPATPELAAQAAREPATTQQQPMQTGMGGISGVDQVIAGLGQEAKAKQQLADESAKIRQDQMAIQQDAAKAYETQAAELETERKALIEDIRAGYVDPEKYWTGDKDGNGGHSKILTGIGMIIAGFNPTTRPNAAIEFLKHQMEQNLKAQQLNLDSKNNLLRANLQQFGNLREATQMTRIMQNDMMVNQLELAAAKASNPMAKAQLLQNAGKLRMENDQKTAAFAKERTAGLIVNEARSNPAKAEQAMQMLEIVDPKRASELRQVYVPGMGFASSNEGAKGVREMQSMVKSASEDIARLKELNKKGGKALSPKLRAEADTIRRGLIGKLRVAITGPGAMSEGEREMLENMIPDVTAMFALDSSNKTRLDTLAQRLQNNLANMAQINGLTPSAGSFAPSKRPDIEEGAIVTGANGKQYKRVGNRMVPVAK